MWYGVNPSIGKEREEVTRVSSARRCAENPAGVVADISRVCARIPERATRGRAVLDRQVVAGNSAAAFGNSSL